MDRASIKLAAACTTALVLAGTSALPAHAYYLGYGNGDPGNWDFWTEQQGGPVQKVEAPAKHAQQAHVHHAQHRAQKKHAG